MPKLALARAEIRCRGKRQANLALAIGVTAVLFAAWLSSDGLEHARRQTAVTPAHLAQRSVCTDASTNAPLVPPVRAVEKTAAADLQPTGRARRAVAPHRRTPTLQDLVRRLETDRVTTLAPVLASLRSDPLRGAFHDIEASLANLDRLRSDESMRSSLAAMSGALRTSATLRSAPAAIHEAEGGERLFLGGQTTLRGFDFREVHAEEPETQE